MKVAWILSAGLLLAQSEGRLRLEAAPEARIEPLRAAVAANPDDAQAQRSLAIVLHEAGEHEQALACFERAAELDPGPRSLLDLALAYQSLAWFTKAADTYDRLLALDPANAIALHNLGNMSLVKGRTEQAIALYTRAIAVRPAYLLAHYHLAQALARAGRQREAYKTYEKVLELEPTSAQELQALDDALFGMASLDLLMGAPERALQLSSALLQLRPEHPQAHYARAQALLQLGRGEEARRALDTHVRLLERQPVRSPMASRD
jgi:tetratricopeptide (TPR) repeat protein